MGQGVRQVARGEDQVEAAELTTRPTPARPAGDTRRLDVGQGDQNGPHGIDLLERNSLLESTVHRLHPVPSSVHHRPPLLDPRRSGHWPQPGRANDLLVALEGTRFSRWRTGASGWRVWQDAADPNRIVEQFMVASWAEHLRQHEPVTIHDQERLDAVRAMTDPRHPTTVTHWLTPQSGQSLDKSPSPRASESPP